MATGFLQLHRDRGSSCRRCRCCNSAVVNGIGHSLWLADVVISEPRTGRSTQQRWSGPALCIQYNTHAHTRIRTIGQLRDTAASAHAARTFRNVFAINNRPKHTISCWRNVITANASFGFAFIGQVFLGTRGQSGSSKSLPKDYLDCSSIFDSRLPYLVQLIFRIVGPNILEIKIRRFSAKNAKKSTPNVLRLSTYPVCLTDNQTRWIHRRFHKSPKSQYSYVVIRNRREMVIADFRSEVQEIASLCVHEEKRTRRRALYVTSANGDQEAVTTVGGIDIVDWLHWPKPIIVTRWGDKPDWFTIIDGKRVIILSLAEQCKTGVQFRPTRLCSRPNSANWLCCKDGGVVCLRIDKENATNALYCSWHIRYLWYINQ